MGIHNLNIMSERGKNRVASGEGDGGWVRKNLLFVLFFLSKKHVSIKM